MILDCDSLSIDNGWSLTRENACHIGNMNEEMGELRDIQSDFGYRLAAIETYVQVNTWIWGIIAATTMAIAVKRIFSKPITE